MLGAALTESAKIKSRPNKVNTVSMAGDSFAVFLNIVGMGDNKIKIQISKFKMTP